MCLQECNRPGGGHHILYRNSMMTSVLRDRHRILRPCLKLKTVICVQERIRPGGRHHTPYLNSMMTTVLRDSLGGKCCCQAQA